MRCGACNEVFDGNAALVEPALKQPVIIDLPASSLAAPTTSPELEALITTLDARHAAAPDWQDDEHEPGRDTDAGADALADADADVAAESAAQSLAASEDAGANAAAVPEASADTPVPAAEDAFDLDLDVDLEALDGEPAPANAEARPPLPWEDDTASGADGGYGLPGDDEESSDALSIGDDDAAEPARAPEAEPQRPAYPPLSALDDEDAPAPAQESEYSDGRREPTLDLPDEHLTAVALHDSFELDAYPRKTGDAGHEADGDADGDADADDDDDDVVTLSSAAAGFAGTGAGGSALTTDSNEDADGRGDGEGKDADDSNGGNGAARDGKDVASGPATPVSAGLPGADDEPGFVKRDRRRQQFGKAARAGMALGIPLLLAALTAQVVGTFRNPLAAAVPALKPALVSACQLAGCKVDLPAQIDALSIEQGELQTLAENVFSFSTTLRNQSRSAQAWPHIELILNDAADKPVLRRVFAPREYLANSVTNAADVDKGFAPRSEQSVKLHFELAQVKASGYHIAVFYP